MKETMAHKQGDMNTGLRVIFCLPGVCVWSSAAYFALKWFAHMARGTIAYGNEATAVLLPILGILAFIGVLGSLAVAVMTGFGKMKVRWQVIIFCAGLIVLWSIAGD